MLGAGIISEGFPWHFHGEEMQLFYRDFTED